MQDPLAVKIMGGEFHEGDTIRVARGKEWLEFTVVDTKFIVSRVLGGALAGRNLPETDSLREFCFRYFARRTAILYRPAVRLTFEEITL